MIGPLSYDPSARAGATGRLALLARGRLRGLLRMPLFYKVLLANAAVVVAVGAVAGAAAHGLLRTRGHLESVGLFLLVGLVCALVTIPLYAAVLRLALSPLDALERAADEVAGGRMDARARLPRLADPRLARVIRVFNRLLDGLAADRQRLRAVAARAFRAQEAERVRVAHELEGETAQTLSALLLKLRVARRAADGERRERLLDELRDDLVGLTDKIRDFALMLHSPTLDEVGLQGAVEAYARVLGGRTGLAIDVRADAVAGLLGDEGELAVYRVVQEALSNVVRHAGATHVRVRLERGPGWVQATVRDDGRGFEVTAAEAGGACLGFFGMRERALYVGGVVEVDSAPGAGTKVTIRAPAAAEAPKARRPAARAPRAMGRAPLRGGAVRRRA
ncbi:MAG TPA: ATP-binding protein [Longimicrobium sp.]|nr:ATP-binding protein [Longimicrobium sp.]